MSKKNNFQILEEQEQNNINFDAENVKHGIDSSMNLFKTFTDVLELYIPRVFDTILEMFNADKDLKK